MKRWNQLRSVPSSDSTGEPGLGKGLASQGFAGFRGTWNQALGHDRGSGDLPLLLPLDRFDVDPPDQRLLAALRREASVRLRDPGQAVLMS